MDKPSENYPRIYTEQNVDSIEVPDNDPIISRLQEQLIDLCKDIELNYSRVYFRNPVVNMVLKTIAKTLRGFVELLDFPEEPESSSNPYTGSDKFTFGTDYSSIS